MVESHTDVHGHDTAIDSDLFSDDGDPHMRADEQIENVERTNCHTDNVAQAKLVDTHQQQNFLKPRNVAEHQEHGAVDVVPAQTQKADSTEIPQPNDAVSYTPIYLIMNR